MTKRFAMTRRSALIAASALSLLAGPALAQHMHEEAPPAPVELPAICGVSDAQNQPVAGHDMSGAMPMDEGHAALMDAMETMGPMMQAMSAEDIDVAFVCGMIPHHQGAIAMARAELAHGDDPWARQLAQTIIDTQEQEIAQMLDWLNSQPE